MMKVDSCFNDYPCGGVAVICHTRYRMDGLICQSSDSRIYSAHSMEGEVNSAFVIKYCCCRKGGERWNRCMREIEAGQMLRRCKHVVALLGFTAIDDRDSGNHHIMLLFERLPCLDDLTVDRRETLEMCRDISLALEQSRKKGLVHGDVKPSNIYRAADGRWLLGDWGSVCLRGEVPGYGSEGYCSPEACMGKPCDTRSDIYALGITCYKLLSGGRLPFCDLPCEKMKQEDVYRAIDRRLSGEPIPPIADAGAGVNELLRGMCSFTARKRFRRPTRAAAFVQKLLETAI